METFKSEADFGVLASSSPVVVIDIFTQWCAPCKKMTPILEELEKEFEGKVKFFKVDVSEGAPQWVIDMKVFSVPTLLFIKDGVIKATEIGLKDKNRIAIVLDDLVTSQ